MRFLPSRIVLRISPVWALSLFVLANPAGAQCFRWIPTIPAPATARRADPQPAMNASSRLQTLANWTGSANITTEPITVPSGTLQLTWWAAPSGQGPSSLTVIAYDDRGETIYTIMSGELTAKRMDIAHLERQQPMRVRLAVTGENVVWGVWAQTR